MILTRDRGNRMWGGDGTSGGGGGGVSSSQLAGMLIGYATESWVDEHYISIDFFSRLFQAHGTENGSEIDVLPNDLETTITSVESMFGFWTNLYISALGSNGAAPAGISLGMLTDVTISGTPSAGQVLTFDAVSGKWVNGNAQAGATALANLTDVTLTSLQGNQILVYNGSAWVNSSVKTINGNSIFGTGDIPASGGGGGNYLPLAGGTMTGSILYQGASGTFNIFGAGTYSVDIGWAYGTGSGAGMGLRGATGNGTENGAFIYYAKNGNTVSHFQGFPNGELWWGASSADSKFRILNNGNFGIGYTNPICKLHVMGTAGDGLPVILADGLRSAQWNFALSALVSDINNGELVVFTLGKAHAAYNSAVLSHCHVGNGSSYNYFSIGYFNNNFLFNVRADGNIGIGTTSPSYKLHVAGTIYATGAITALSDARKKDITGEAGVTVEQIAHAPAVQFLWKDKERRKDGQQVGTLAQYWKTVLPEVVMDKGGELSMQYGVAALVSSIIIARKVANHEIRIDKMEKWMKKWAEENDE